MGYVAIKGGEDAIKAALNFYEKEFVDTNLELKQIQKSMRLAVDRVMSEGSLYSKKLAAKSLLYSSGDSFNAAFFLRAHRSSCQRIGIAKRINTDEMRLVRRISSAFKEIQGGQILGPSNDYQIKLLYSLAKKELDFNTEDFSTEPLYLSSALNPLRDAGFIKTQKKDEKTADITRVFPNPPYARSALMQAMSRAESGSLLGFAYTSMRGYGDIHPTIGDLRLGLAKLKITHPLTQKEVVIGELELSACECVGELEQQEDGSVSLNTGFGFCFGFNETKVICMGILDLNLYGVKHRDNDKHFASNAELIMHHIDGVDSMGFSNHYKLPHYVTFQAILQAFENAKNYTEGQK